MSYSQELASQAQGFSNIGREMAERGQERIDDYNIEEGEYNGAEVAHRNGIQAIKTGAELPRLAEAYMSKPLGKKLISYAVKKTGLSDTKVGGMFKTAKALKEGKYGEAASAAAETAGISIPKDIDTIIQKGGKGVRQLGSDKFKALSENARGKLPKGTVDEGGIPYNSKDFTSNDVRRGIQQGRLRVNKDDSITDTATGQTHTPPSVEGLKGGAKVRFEGGQARLEDEAGEAWSAEKSFGRDEPQAAAYESIQRNIGGFQGTAETQATLDRITAARDKVRGSVDLRATGRKVEDAGKVSRREARIERLSGRQPRPSPAEPAEAPVREQSLAGARLSGQGKKAVDRPVEESAEAAARSTTTKGGYADTLAPMRELMAPRIGAGGVKERLETQVKTKEELPTSQSTTVKSATKDIAPVSKKEIEEKGAETFGKTVGETEAKAAADPVDEVPGLGEVVMGLSAAWGLIKGGIKEHQEVKTMKADAPKAPETPAQETASQPQTGVSFNVAPVLDSDNYHHL